MEANTKITARYAARVTIQKRAAAAAGITVSEMLSGSRSEAAITARRLYAVVARDGLGDTLAEIAAALNRPARSSVLTLLRGARRQMEASSGPTFADLVQTVALGTP